MSSTQFHVYLPWVKPFEHSILIYLFFILKCKNTGKHFQLGKGPSRGFLCLCDCENFAKLFFPALLLTADNHTATLETHSQPGHQQGDAKNIFVTIYIFTFSGANF